MPLDSTPDTASAGPREGHRVRLRSGSVATVVTVIRRGAHQPPRYIVRRAIACDDRPMGWHQFPVGAGQIAQDLGPDPAPDTHTANAVRTGTEAPDSQQPAREARP